MMISHVSSPGTGDPGAPRDLAEACRQFEGIFISELLKPLDGALTGGQGGAGALGSLARQTVASELAGSLGVGELLYQQLAEEARV